MAEEKEVILIDSGLYSPKAEHTVKSWEEIKVLLPCTYAQLEQAGKDHKNKGFLPYLKQRKAIVPEGTDLSKLKPVPKTKAPKKPKEVKVKEVKKSKKAA